MLVLTCFLFLSWTLFYHARSLHLTFFEPRYRLMFFTGKAWLEITIHVSETKMVVHLIIMLFIQPIHLYYEEFQELNQESSIFHVSQPHAYSSSTLQLVCLSFSTIICDRGNLNQRDEFSLHFLLFEERMLYLDIMT